MAGQTCRAGSKDSPASNCSNNVVLRRKSTPSLIGGEVESPPFSSVSGSEEDDNRRLKRKVAGLMRYTEQLERHLLRVHNLWQKETEEKMRVEKIAIDIAKGAANLSHNHKRPRAQESSHPAPAQAAPSIALHNPQQQQARQPYSLPAEHHLDTNQELGRKIRAAASSYSTPPHQQHMPHQSMEQYVCEWGDAPSVLDKEFVSDGNLVDPLAPPNHDVQAWAPPSFMPAPAVYAW